tara:strand:- start:198 stop:440 length:243 start_codon:yes stop_codon:yes gene_type:complete
MNFFKKKNSKEENLESKLEKGSEKLDIPVNEYDRLKCIYYNEFQKKEMELYQSNPVEFWRKATEYAEKKLRAYEYDKKIN